MKGRKSAMSQDYNSTLNLLKTNFPMKASLPQREPELLKKWQDEKLYVNLQKMNEGKPLYVLHDGPPYANGDIHLGTALNKVLKDIIVRSKNMTGFKAPYIPGFDTHGLPIERRAIDKVGLGERNLDPIEFRKHCRDFALSYVDIQTEQFKRLGVIGDWENPYLTLNAAFEAKQIEIFGDMALKGYIYKGLKPVYWCAHDETALAEAEIEYSDDPCDTIFVKFLVKNDNEKLYRLGAEKGKTYFVIWTTTTWTLPGNVAIAVGPNFEYSIVKAKSAASGETEYYIMAKELVESAMKAAATEYEVISSIKGSELELITTQHPFLDRDSIVILGDLVTLESGTGCVHIAPGHGAEDFIACQKYPQIPIVVPVDSKGKLTKEAAQFEGLTTEQANKAILEHLKNINALLAVRKIIHPYPHCWRCKHPVIYRATEQWFCSVEDFKDEAIKAINAVKWIPEWGQDRITSMVRDRSDWCISRQRIWGVPIPIFYCKDCGKELITKESIHAVSSAFRKEGSDAWYKYTAAEILPQGTKCSCGCGDFVKETDIMDVWFDSGVSHAAVCDEREELTWPADLYLEGNDQYRGWFQSSLLTSVAWRGKAPYKSVITHGMVVDGEGRKMSKSIGNTIPPDYIIKEYGADILRLWIASSDYQSDIRISKEILKQLSEAYRKIRNTARFILSNVSDFDPNTDSVKFSELLPIDKWAVNRLDNLIQKVDDAYKSFEFHVIFHAIHNFCVLDMSNFYLDVIKDRLYVEKSNSLSRRSAQTVIFNILDAMTKMIAPILAFTSEEIWSYMPRKAGENTGSVTFNQMSKPSGEHFDETFLARWERIHSIRDDVTKALELARIAKVIGKSLEAKVTLYCSKELYEFVKLVEEELATVFIVSSVELRLESEGDFKGDVEGLSVSITHADGKKCERCWVYSETVGECEEHPTLCSRCASIVK
jgi:isoleucyl-tRNA synthetase